MSSLDDAVAACQGGVESLKVLRRLLRAARTDDVPLPEKDLGIASKVVDVAMHALLETAGLEHELEHRAIGLSILASLAAKHEANRPVITHALGRVNEGFEAFFKSISTLDATAAAPLHVAMFTLLNHLSTDTGVHGRDLLSLTGQSIARAVDITAAVLQDPGSVSPSHSAGAAAALKAGAVWSDDVRVGGDAQTAAIIVLCDFTSPEALLPPGTDASLETLAAGYAKGMSALVASILRTRVLVRVAGLSGVWLHQALDSLQRFGAFSAGAEDWAEPAHLSTLCAVTLCNNILSVTASHTHKFRSHLVGDSAFFPKVIVPYLQLLLAWLDWSVSHKDGGAEEAVLAQEVLEEGLMALRQAAALAVWCTFRSGPARECAIRSGVPTAFSANAAVQGHPLSLALAVKLLVNCDALGASDGQQVSSTVQAVRGALTALSPEQRKVFSHRLLSASAAEPVAMGGNTTFEHMKFAFEISEHAPTIGAGASALQPPVEVPTSLLGSGQDSETAADAAPPSDDPDAFPSPSGGKVAALTATSVLQRFSGGAPAAGLSAVRLVPEFAEEAEADDERAGQPPLSAPQPAPLTPVPSSPAAQGAPVRQSVPAAAAAAPRAIGLARAPHHVRPLSRALRRTRHAPSGSPLQKAKLPGLASGHSAPEEPPQAGFTCALTGLHLEVPVRLKAEGGSGPVYEREALEEHLNKNGRSAEVQDIVPAPDVQAQMQQSQVRRLLRL